MIPASDEALVRAACAGDKGAFGRLAERYQPLAVHIAAQMVGGESAADLAQDALLQAYLSIGRLRQPERFASWFYGIVLNVCRSFLRQRKIDFFSLENLTGGLRYDGPLFANAELDPQAAIETEELHERVVQAVNSLSPANRAATLLFYYEELSLQEIAVLLGLSLSAVKSRLYQSRQHLKASLVEFQRESTNTDIHIHIGREITMVQVKIADVVIEGPYDHRIVILADEVGKRALPIWVGPFEGDSIAVALKGMTLERPLTFDFLTTILNATGASLQEVEIAALKENTFYAIVRLKTHSGLQELDARPSDAIAVALRSNSPIYVAAEVMESTGHAIPEPTPEPIQMERSFYSQLREVHVGFAEAEFATGAEKQHALWPFVKKEAHLPEPSPEEKKIWREELMNFVFGNVTTNPSQTQ